MLVVQDIFLTETAYLADVILPASAFPEKTGTFTNTDRMVQLGRQALDAPGEARKDLDIIIDIGRRLGLDWTYTHPRDVFAEMRLAMPSIAGITWERLEQRKRGHLSVRARRRPGRARRVHRALPDRDRPREARAGRRSFPPRSSPTASTRSC